MTMATRVLLLEDDEAFRTLLLEAFEDEGIVTRSCGSYGELLGCVRNDRPSLVVVDFWGESHHELSAPERSQIEHLSLAVPVILLTGRTWIRSIAPGEFPNVTILAKPVDLDALFVTVWDRLQGAR